MGIQHRSPQTFRIWPTTDWSWQISTPTVQSVVPPGHVTSCDPSHDCQPVCIVSIQSWIAHRTLPNSEWYLPRSVWPNWPRRWCHHYIILETHPKIRVLNDRSTFQWDDNRRRFKRSRLLVWNCWKMAFGQNQLFSLTLSHHAFSLSLSSLCLLPLLLTHTHFFTWYLTHRVLARMLNTCLITTDSTTIWSAPLTLSFHTRAILTHNYCEKN